MIPVLRSPTPEDTRSVVYPTPSGDPPPPAATPPPIGPTPPPGAPNPASPAGSTQQQQDGYAYLKSVLSEYGLEELSDWAWQQIVAGNSPTQILQELRKTDAFRRRFRVIFERQAKGLAPLSPAEVIAYERQARQMFMRAGMPPGFYDSNDDFDRFMVNDVSLAELSDRINLGREALYQMDPTTRRQLQSFYGFTEGDMVAWVIDPNLAVPAIARRFQAARTASASIRSGFGGLSREEAERFADLGISPEQAEQGFGTLVQSRELLSSLPGERGENIGREQQLAAITGDATAQQAIERQRSRRVAQFRGGGGFATDKEGFSGLGVADQ